jgi:hypothetical protein
MEQIVSLFEMGSFFLGDFIEQNFLILSKFICLGTLRNKVFNI